MKSDSAESNGNKKTPINDNHREYNDLTNSKNNELLEDVLEGMRKIPALQAQRMQKKADKVDELSIDVLQELQIVKEKIQ